MSTVAGTARYLGTSVPRREDRALLTGGARFVDDLTLPGTVYMAVVRSPYAHARIRGVSLDAARSADGVVAAFSGADLADDWKGSLPCAWPVTEDIKLPPHYPLAVDEARFQGDGVAVVIADTRGAAKDAAELVEVDYEPLDAVPTSRRRSQRALRSSIPTSERTSATSGHSRPTASTRRSPPPR